MENRENIFDQIQDYMFTSKNLIRYTKHMIHTTDKNNRFVKNGEPIHNKSNPSKKNTNKTINNKFNTDINTDINKCVKHRSFDLYKPKQKDSLFWCFYILKHGYFNYEMEINNKYFVVEKAEKIKYVGEIRNNKDMLKIHKIKPFTEIEDDLANKDKISIKTFFALCVLENINVLLIDKRKMYELLCVDIDEAHPVHIVHRNSQTGEHHIEVNATSEVLQKYRDNYYKMSSFDASLKSMGSYKLEELVELCKRLNINISDNPNKKKQTKKDIYELLVLNY